MSQGKLTIESVSVRPVLLPLKRPVVSKVGLFDEWPLILIDLYTEEGIVGRSYLEPYLEQAARYLVPAIEDIAERFSGEALGPVGSRNTSICASTRLTIQ